MPCVPIALNSGLFWPRRASRSAAGHDPSSRCSIRLRRDSTSRRSSNGCRPRSKPRPRGSWPRASASCEAAACRPCAAIRRLRYETAPARRQVGGSGWVSCPLSRSARRCRSRSRMPSALERAHRLEHVVAIVAGSAVSLPHQVELLRRASAGRHIAHGRGRPRSTPPRRFVPACRRARPPARFHDRPTWPVRARAGKPACPAGGAPPRDRQCRGRRRRVEAEHQARPLGRAAMHERIDGERTMQPDHPRRNAFQEFEARSPDQRAIAEHPEILVGTVECGIHGWRFAIANGSPIKPARALQPLDKGPNRRETAIL